MSATSSADIPQFEINSGPGPEDVYVVRVAGEVDMSHEEELRHELRTAVAADSKGIVVDLTECEFIDSTGIALIVRAWQRLDRNAEGDGKGRVVIASQNDQVRRVLEITGLELSIPIHSTREEALAALRT